MYMYTYIYSFSLYTCRYTLWLDGEWPRVFSRPRQSYFFRTLWLVESSWIAVLIQFLTMTSAVEMLMRCHKQIVWKDNGMQQQFDEFAIVGNFLHLSWARFDRFATACQTLFLVIVMGCTLYSNTWVPRIGNSGVRVIILLPNWMAMRSKLVYENI